jgi:hypothetical protein
MAALAQSGPSEYTQLISRPANLGGSAPQQAQPMMQPLAMPMVQPPVLQPPVMQPPMIQPVIQPPVMQAPVIQPPMMAVPVPQPAKGKFPWQVLLIGLLIGVVLATAAVALYLVKR